MSRKLISLSLLLTTASTVVGMEVGCYRERKRKAEISEANLPTDAITLISNEGAEFQVTPHIVEFSDTIKGFFEASSVLLPPSSELTLETKEYTLRDFASKPVELLANLVNKVQEVIDSQANDKELALGSLIKAPNGHIVAKNLQKVVNEELVNETIENLKQLLRLTDCFMMPEFCNAVASVYLREAQKQYRISDTTDFQTWVASWEFSESINELLAKHWYLQQAGITQEWSIKDLLATAENKPVMNSEGDLNLSYKKLTSLDGLYDIPHIECVKALYLHDNQLTVLKAGKFNGLITLKNLYLTNNQLTVLEAEVFNGLSALEWLYLYGNKLTVLEPEVFNGLSALKWLDLGKNQLAEQNKQEIEVKIKQIAPNCKIVYPGVLTWPSP